MLHLARLSTLLVAAVAIASSAVGSTAVGNADAATALSAPTGLKVSPQGGSWFVMRWTASPGATGYKLYVNGVPTSTSTQTAYNYQHLVCGTSYKLGVAATKSSSLSAIATMTGTTDACPPPPPPPPDTTAPSVPANLAGSGITTTAASLSWTAATDKVGVTGYDVSLNGTRLAQTAGTVYALTTLTCSTGYNVSVDAYDAAGNHSGQASLELTAAACPPPPPPPPPAPLTTTGALWSASSFLNTPIANFTASSSSAGWLSMLSNSETYGLWVDSLSWAAPLYHAAGTTATVTVSIANTGRHISIPYQSSFQPDPSGDAQLAVIDDTTGCEYEFQGFNPATLTAHAEGTFHAYTGSGLHANDAGVTGSNISVLGGLITAKDVASGTINHALRYATPYDAPTFVAPASRTDGSLSGGIPAGQLMRLDPALNLSGLGLTPFQLQIAKALQTYGAYNADAAGSFKLYAESTVDGSTYATAVGGLPWSIVSHLQFGSAALGSTATDTNSDITCSQQH